MMQKSLSRLIMQTLLIAGMGIVLVLLAGSLLFNKTAQGADAKKFDPGHIIDDSIFYNSGSMTATQIQDFLNAKNPNCDTNGTQPASDWGRPDITRATLASYIRNGTNGYTKNTNFHAPPYTCTKNYKQNTPQMPAASGLCEGLSAKSNRTAAQIIKDVADACGINPQVLLVLIQKEQSLVTDTWPLNIQYKSATGFDCPDTAPCDPAYAGFFYQVYHAARQFKVYKVYPNSYNYVAGRTNRIYWHPDLSRCGSSQVYIENQATAALYIYTPYRPNQAALNNMYGTGDSCSSYGNRNFWRFFTDWFGPTTDPLISSSGLLLYGWNTGDQITAVFDIKNTSKSTQNIDYVRVRAVNEKGDQYLFTPKTGLSLKSGERYKYQESVVMDKEGIYTFYIDRKIGSTWISPPFSDLNYTGKTTNVRTILHKTTLKSSLNVDKPTAHINEPVTATFTAKNNSAISSAEVGLLKAEAFDTNGKQYQFATDNDIVLAPGQTYSYNSTMTFNKTGLYTFEIVNYHANRGWNKTFPEADNGSITRKIDINVKDQVTLTQGLTITQPNIREGDTTTATFKIKNFGNTPVNVGLLKVEAFDASGKQYQFASTSENLTLSPGQEYTYTSTLTLTKKGTYAFYIANKHPQSGWNTSLPAPETNGLARSGTVTVKPQAELTSSLSITPTSPLAGNTLTATFKVRNYGTTPVNVGLLKVEAFDASGKQYQFASTSENLTLSPGQEYTYTSTLTLTKKGTYAFYIANKHPQSGWNQTLPQSQSNNILRTQTVTVK